MSIGLYRGKIVLEKHQSKQQENAKETISLLTDILSDAAIDIQHVCIYDSDTWNDYINMRDYLLCHEEDAKKYEDLKKELALYYHKDRKTYTQMKSSMIQEILDKARMWHKETDNKS